MLSGRHSQQTIHSKYILGQLFPSLDCFCLLPHCVRFLPAYFLAPFYCPGLFFSMPSFSLPSSTNWLKSKTNIRPSNFALANFPCQGTDPEHLPEDIFIAFGFIIGDKIYGNEFLFPRSLLLVVYFNTRWYFLIKVIYK